MSKIWVYKADGSIQCVPSSETEISLAEMRKDLIALIGADNILNEEKRGPQGPVIAQCGRPTGQVNAYEITPEGLRLLITGTVGTGGFTIYPDTTIDPPPPEERIDSNTKGDRDPVVPWPVSVSDRWTPWPWAALSPLAPPDIDKATIAFIASLTEVAAQPTLISELKGRECRVYNVGDFITFDHKPARVNVELDRNTINRIWFG